MKFVQRSVVLEEKLIQEREEHATALQCSAGLLYGQWVEVWLLFKPNVEAEQVEAVLDHARDNGLVPTAGDVHVAVQG